MAIEEFFPRMQVAFINPINPRQEGVFIAVSMWGDFGEVFMTLERYPNTTVNTKLLAETKESIAARRQAEIERRAFGQGQDCKFDGGKLKHNPYLPLSPEWKAWLNGYRSQEAEDRRDIPKAAPTGQKGAAKEERREADRRRAMRK